MGHDEICHRRVPNHVGGRTVSDATLIPSKLCIHCERHRPATPAYFYRKVRMMDQLSSICNDCSRAHKQASRARNRPHVPSPVQDVEYGQTWRRERDGAVVTMLAVTNFYGYRVMVRWNGRQKTFGLRQFQKEWRLVPT